MSLTEMLPVVRSLSRIEKIRLIQFLAEDLAQADEGATLVAERSYPLWSPDQAYDAAAVLLRELEAERAQR